MLRSSMLSTALAVRAAMPLVMDAVIAQLTAHQRRAMYHMTQAPQYGVMFITTFVNTILSG